MPGRDELISNAEILALRAYLATLGLTPTKWNQVFTSTPSTRAEAAQMLAAYIRTQLSA